MNLMTSEAALRLNQATNAAEAALGALFFATSDAVLGKVLLARSARGVCAILLGDDAGELEADLARRFPEATLVANEVMVRDDLAKLARYAEKPSEGLDLALDMRAPTRCGERRESMESSSSSASRSARPASPNIWRGGGALPRRDGRRSFATMRMALSQSTCSSCRQSRSGCSTVC